VTDRADDVQAWLEPHAGEMAELLQRLVAVNTTSTSFPRRARRSSNPSAATARFIGRGSADMKGGLVSMLYGAAAATEFGLLDGRRIVFHFVCDEETGSAAGSGHLREAELIVRRRRLTRSRGNIVWPQAVR